MLRVYPVTRWTVPYPNLVKQGYLIQACRVASGSFAASAWNLRQVCWQPAKVQASALLPECSSISAPRKNRSFFCSNTARPICYISTQEWGSSLVVVALGGVAVADLRLGALSALRQRLELGVWDEPGSHSSNHWPLMTGYRRCIARQLTPSVN